MHTGVSSAVTFNPASGRMVYGGSELAMARAVQGAACGGMTLMSDTTAKLVSTGLGVVLYSTWQLRARRAERAQGLGE